MASLYENPSYLILTEQKACDPEDIKNELLGENYVKSLIMFRLNSVQISDINELKPRKNTRMNCTLSVLEQQLVHVIKLYNSSTFFRNSFRTKLQMLLKRQENRKDLLKEKIKWMLCANGDLIIKDPLKYDLDSNKCLAKVVDVSTSTPENDSKSNFLSSENVIQKYEIPCVNFIVKATYLHPIEQRWCWMLATSVMERITVEENLSWLSTLGGACSALGDNDERWADRAAFVSHRQMAIANRIGDPFLIARCWLYGAIAAIQKGHYRVARTIIARQYGMLARMSKEQRDTRLVKMCRGIWTKLLWTKNNPI